MRRPVLLALASLLAAPAAALLPAADCADGSCFPGGGSAKKDCIAEFAHVHPNEPAPDPSRGKVKPKKEWSCFDGDAGCDLDGQVNGSCRFPVDVCLFNTDPNLPECTPAAVSEVKVKAKKSGDGGAALQAAVDALLPAAAPACTQDASVDVPLKVKGSGQEKAGKVTVKVKAKSDAGGDGDKLKLTCLPREWPSHGYSHYNTRSAERSAITPANVASLEVKWTFESPPTASGPAQFNGTTSTPAVTDKMVYVTSWNGHVYGLDRKSGKVKWDFDTGALGGGAIGVQSSVTVTPDGRVLVGDSNGVVYAFGGKKGNLLWSNDLGDGSVDAIWGSPQVVNNVVMMGIASHSDQPCTQGRLVALDLDDGSVLWTTRTAPDRVCEDDTRLGCTLDGDCPSGRCVGMCSNDRSIACQDDVECGAGTCGDVIGGGVTATAGASADGQTAYMVSVGCFTSPRVGNADRIFALDMATGAVQWAEPDLGPEPFTDGPPYRDYGFLNGPIVIPDGGAAAILAASKNGRLYSRDPLTGGELFTAVGEEIADGFAGFGWFNGAPALADGRVYASGYGFPSINGSRGRCTGNAVQICWDDSDCGADGPCDQGAPLSHMRAFDAATGAPVWEESSALGATFGSVAEAGGVVFVGASGVGAGTPDLYAFDASDGSLITTLTLPNLTSSGAAAVGDELFVGFGPNVPLLFGIGQSGAGGVIAFELP